MNIKILKKIRKRFRVIKVNPCRWELWDLKFKRPANVFYDWNMSAFQNMWVQSIENTFGSRHWLYSRREKKRQSIVARKNAIRLNYILKGQP